jgi:high-affinity iron transporter
MFGSALIIFRETLEAALVIGIIAAATRGVSGRTLWLIIGVTCGVIGSFILATLTDTIADFAEGTGQELFNAAVLAIAVVMIAWHNIWMSTHGAELARDAKRIGSEVKDGQRELSAIAILVALTVLREGAESVLFLHGMATGSETSLMSMLTGGALGLLGGAIVGTLMFVGLMRIPLRWFFSVTGTLLLLLAAGLSSQMAKMLIQADWIPALVSPLWDLSSVLPTNSVIGSILHVLIGYEASPSGMQIIFYAGTIAIIVGLTALVRRNQQQQQQQTPQAKSELNAATT